MWAYVCINEILNSYSFLHLLADANENKQYMEELTTLMRTRKIPKFKMVRFVGQLCVGYFYGMLVKLALPVDEVPVLLVDLLVCFGICVGVHLVGNIGRQQGNFTTPFLVTVFCSCFVRFYLNDDVSGFLCTAAASTAFSYGREFRRTKPTRGVCKRMAMFSACATVVFALWIAFFYFNAEITTDDGETIKVRDSVNHFFKSPAWVEFKSTMWELYEHGRQNGWKNLYNEFVKALDPKGEANARKVLGVASDATVEEIKRVYKKLVRQWHPDRHKVDSEKAEAQRKFMEIQGAYDILTSKKSAAFRDDADTDGRRY